MSRFTSEQQLVILKKFYELDEAIHALGHHLLAETLEKMNETNSLKPLERWVRTWKKNRLNVQKLFHRYGLIRSRDKKDIHSLFTLYLDDKNVSCLFRSAPDHIRQMITQAMGVHPLNVSVKHPQRGFAERVVSRLAQGMNIREKHR